MIGIILAAGAGSRLRPFTDTLPKCLVNVNGIPVIQYQLDAFNQVGINKLVIVTGYLSKNVKEFLNKRSNDLFDICVVENKDFALTNNMYSLWLTKHLVDNDIILTNGDVIFDPWILHALCTARQENLVSADIGNYIDESMKIEVQNDVVIKISKTIPPDCAFATSIDLYRLNKNATAKLFQIIDESYIRKNNLTQWTEVALQDLFAYESFSPFDIQGKRWIEIDTPTDLKNAERLFR